jgi:hypothetical protein
MLNISLELCRAHGFQAKVFAELFGEFEVVESIDNVNMADIELFAVGQNDVRKRLARGQADRGRIDEPSIRASRVHDQPLPPPLFVYGEKPYGLHMLRRKIQHPPVS